MTDSKDLRAVVVGSGRTGLRTARLLDGRGHNVVIIERNPERVRALVEDHNVIVIEGDATNPDILRQANLDAADLIIAMTDTMGTNFTVCTLAAEINPQIRTVMRSVYENTTGYAGFVDEIIVPEEAGARAVVTIAEGGINTP